MTMNLGSRFDETTQRMFVDLRDQNDGDAVGVISEAIKRYWSDCFVKPTSRVTAPVGVRNMRDEMLKAIRRRRGRNGVELARVHRDFIDGVYEWSRDNIVSLHRLSIMSGYKHESCLSNLMSRLRSGKACYANAGIVGRLEMITGLKNCSKSRKQTSKPKASKDIKVRVTPAYANAVEHYILSGGYTLTATSDTLFGKPDKLRNLLYHIRYGQKVASEYEINMIEQFTEIHPSQFR